MNNVEYMIFVQFKEQCLDETCFEQVFNSSEKCKIESTGHNRSTGGCSENGVDNGYCAQFNSNNPDHVLHFTREIQDIGDVGAVQIVKYQSDNKENFACFFSKITFPTSNVREMLSPFFEGKTKLQHIGEPVEMFHTKLKDCPCASSKNRDIENIITAIYDLNKDGFQTKNWSGEFLP